MDPLSFSFPDNLELFSVVCGSLLLRGSSDPFLCFFMYVAISPFIHGFFLIPAKVFTSQDLQSMKAKMKTWYANNISNMYSVSFLAGNRIQFKPVPS